MDQNLQQKIDEARKNGYTDEEIQQYLATSQQPVPTQVPIDRSEEYKGLAQGIALDTMGNVIDVGGKAAAVGAGAYGAKKAFDYIANRGPVAPQVAQQAAQQVRQQVAQQAAQQAGARATGTAGQQAFGQMAEQLADNRIRFPTQPTQSVAPSAGVQPGPVRPAEMPQQSMIERASQTVRQLAANKAVQNMAKFGGLASLSLYSPELGPQTPTTGRMRGMEINPMTRRPWTPQEIKQYENNPMAFDSMLGPVQARR